MLLTFVVYFSYALKDLFQHSLTKMICESCFVDSSSELSEVSLSCLSITDSDLGEEQEMFSSNSSETEMIESDFMGEWIIANAKINNTKVMAKLNTEAWMGGVPSYLSLTDDSPLKTIEGREKTFEGNWSPAMVISAYFLAYNGFFFQDFPDTVNCFVCGLSMKSLNPALEVEEFHYHYSMLLNCQVPCELAKARLLTKQQSQEKPEVQHWMPRISEMPELTMNAELTSSISWATDHSPSSTASLVSSMVEGVNSRIQGVQEDVRARRGTSIIRQRIDSLVQGGELGVEGAALMASSTAGSRLGNGVMVRASGGGGGGAHHGGCSGHGCCTARGTDVEETVNLSSSAFLHPSN